MYRHVERAKTGCAALLYHVPTHLAHTGEPAQGVCLSIETHGNHRQTPHWGHVFQHVNARHLPHRRGRGRETLAVPSAQSMARSGSAYDDMRMIPARFA